MEEISDRREGVRRLRFARTAGQNGQAARIGHAEGLAEDRLLPDPGVALEEQRAEALARSGQEALDRLDLALASDGGARKRHTHAQRDSPSCVAPIPRRSRAITSAVSELSSTTLRATASQLSLPPSRAGNAWR